MTRQNPLPGLGGAVRFGRQAAASAQDRPAFEPGRLPLRFKTEVDPTRVLLHVSIPGEPRPKLRPRHSRAHISDRTGELIQGHTYNPRQNEEAEQALRWVFLAARKSPRPTPGPVGVLMLFRSASSKADADNLAKSVLDAMNGTVLVDDQQVEELHVHVLRQTARPGTDLLVWSRS